MPLWIYPLSALIFGYLLGSIPFGYIIAKVMGAGDIRKIGSGNIGATNVLRTGRKGLALATLVLDALKGAAAVLIAQHFDQSLGILAAVAAFFGHLFPFWLKFKGGKGVATMLGICFALAWPIGLVFALVWIGVIAATRISSLGGMAASFSAPITAVVIGQISLGVGLLGMALILILKHSENITRLMAGTEPHVGQKPQ